MAAALDSILLMGEIVELEHQEQSGRVIAVVDANVWRLHGDALRAWADSLELRLDAVVAPGNEDQKTMDNCLYMLDALKRLSRGRG